MFELHKPTIAVPGAQVGPMLGKNVRVQINLANCMRHMSTGRLSGTLHLHNCLALLAGAQVLIALYLLDQWLYLFREVDEMKLRIVE